MNDLVTHYETAGTPYYTAAGDTAARDGNIYVSSFTSTADTQAIDWWMGAPFHAMGLMDPRLTSTGFGSFRVVKSSWQMGATIDVLRGNSFTGGTWPVLFPGNGTTEPLTSYSGYEWPDPLQACPGYAMPTGLPIFVETGGNVATTVTANSLSANGVQLAHCVIDSHNSAVGSSLFYRGAAILIPRQPLQAGTTYTVSLTVNNVPYTWSFTVGQFATCNVTASTTPASPAAPGTGVTINASATGCLDPVYEFWKLAPGSTTWQLAQPYSSSSTYAWSTSGLTGGTWRFSIWARAAAGAGTFGNSLGRWDGYTATSFALTFTPCATATANAQPAVAAPGVPVTVTGAATGCTYPMFEFWMLPPGAGTWQLAQTYSSSATFPWSTTGKSPGTYQFSVWVRDARSPGLASNVLGSWDSYTVAGAVLDTACSGLTLGSTPVGSAPRGTAVTLNASSSACTHPLYEFWVLAPGSQTWQLAQAYSSSPQLKWSTTGLPAGVYHFSGWARDSGSPGEAGNVLGRWDTYLAAQYSLT